MNQKTISFNQEKQEREKGRSYQEHIGRKV